MHAKALHRRSGIAAIELLMNLPILAVLFVLLLTVSAAGLATFRTVLEARNKAWARRNIETTTERLELKVPDRLTLILRREAAIVATAGKVSAEAEGRLDYGYEPIVDHLPAIERQNSLFAGVWDGQAIAFDQLVDHQRLSLDRRFENFGFSGADRTAFRGLVP